MRMLPANLLSMSLMPLMRTLDWSVYPARVNQVGCDWRRSWKGPVSGRQVKGSCLWPGECVSPLQFPVKDKICCPVLVGILDTIGSCGSWGGDQENVQVLAMRQLDRNGFQGYQEPLVEALLQSLSYHRNLVNLIGYGADNNRLFLLYDCAPSSFLKDRLYGKLLNFLSKL